MAGDENTPRVAGHKTPYLVPFKLVLKYMRLSESQLSEEDALLELYTAIKNHRLTTWIPRKAIHRIDIVEDPESGYIPIFMLKDIEHLRDAEFSKDEVLALWPPRQQTATEGRKEER